MAASSILLPNGDYLPAQSFSQDGHTTKAQEIVLCDAAGNVVGTAGQGLGIKHDVPAAAAAAFTASTQALTPVTTGYASAIISFSGTYGAFTALLQGDNGAGTYPAALGKRQDTGALASTLSLGANASVTYVVDVAALAAINVYALTFASGTCNVRITLSSAPVNTLVGVTPFGTFTVDTELAAAAAQADGQANPTTPPVAAFNSMFNGTTWDRWRSNLDGTALASAARTATANGSDITNYNGRGVVLFVNVTAVTATPLLQVNVQGKDPISGSYYKLAADPTAVGATGLFIYEFYPGASGAAAGGVTARTACSLPRVWRAIGTHGDTDSITYSVGYSLIN